MLKNKKERFYEILKKYGVKEFWATPGLLILTIQVNEENSLYFKDYVKIQ